MGNALPKKWNEEEQQHQEEEEEDGTCEICIEPITPPTQFFKNGTTCTHPFCNDCIIKYIAVRIEDDSCQIPCPALNCSNFLNPLECRRLIPSQLLDKWCDLLCESALLGLDRCYCPNRDCSALVLNECGPVKRAECPNCKEAFCFQCKTTWHTGYTCRDSRGTRDAEDVAFGVLAETNKWMPCPSCHRFVELIDGCNNVKCRCGKRFCYKCGEDVFRCKCRGGVLFHICVEICAWAFFGVAMLVFCVPILIVLFLYAIITSCI